MKFNVTFKVIWDGDYEYIDFEFDSKDLESLHRNVKTAIDEKYLEPEKDIKKTMNGEVTITYTSIKDSMGNEIYTK